MTRAATINDISSIVRVRIETLTTKEVREFSTPEFAIYSSTEELRNVWALDNKWNDGFTVFVAKDERKIVGFIVFEIEYDHGYIDNIAVTKEEQRKGIGRALVTYVEDYAKSNGCYMKTDTSENAKGVPWKSYSFWKRMSYEILECNCLPNMNSKRSR